MIPQLCVVFGSRTKALEILFILEGAKEVVRQGFYPEELPLVEKFCREKKLFLVKSPFKVLLDDERYSNSGERVPMDHPQGMFFVYISKDERKALLAGYYETNNNHHELGRLLGYPDCCIRYFENTFPLTNTNPECPSTNPFTNISLRNQDTVLISHFPCSAACRESIAIGQNHLGIMGRYDRKLAEDYVRLLSKR